MTGKLRPYDEPPPRRRALIPGAPGTAAITFLLFGILWLLSATGLGALAQLLRAFPLGFEFPLLFGFAFHFDAQRVEVAFGNTLVYGWLGNAGIAAVCFITPRLVGRPLMGERAGFGAALVWNLMAVGPGLAALYVFDVAGRPALTEFLFLFDLAALLALTIVNGIFWITLFGARRIYVSAWFFGAALLAFPGLIFIGIIPELIGAVVALLVPEATGLHEHLIASVGRFVADGIVGFWVTGVALGVLFYVVPRASGAPLYSSGLAWLAFATWFVLTGGSTLRGLLGALVPFGVVTLGIVSTMLLLVPAFLAAANLLITLRGRFTLALGAGTIGFAVISLTFLVSHALLDAIGALRPSQAFLAGTSWYPGLLLLAALGTATFAHFAVADHALPRLLRRSWKESALSEAQLWTIFVGLALAVPAMMLGGLANGSLLVERAPAEEIDAVLVWFRLAAAAGLGLANLGALALALNLFLLYTRGRPASYVTVSPPPAAPTEPMRPATAITTLRR